jgi:drug/metabolite transporter (DMT)-like permease
VALKFGALSLGGFSVVNVLTNIFYLLALFFLFLQAFSWQQSLRRFNLSHAYMFTSLYYPFILLASYFIFSESLTLGNIAGTAIIITGLLFTRKPEKSNV